MRRSRIRSVVLLGLLVVGAAAPVVLAQSPRPQAPAVARTGDGRPDFEGVWNLATVTPLQRPDRFAGRPFMTDEEAKAFERQALRAAEGGRGDQNGMGGLNGPPINEFWKERGGPGDHRWQDADVARGRTPGWAHSSIDRGGPGSTASTHRIARPIRQPRRLLTERALFAQRLRTSVSGGCA